MDLYIGIAGLVVSVVGILFAYYLGRKSRQRPEFYYASDFDVLVEPEDGLVAGGLSLYFLDQEISRVSRTYIALWNRRGDTILGSDIVAADPLRIQLAPDDIVLQARIISRSRAQPNITLLNPKVAIGSSIPISFDFLDPGDGAIFEVLHQQKVQPIVSGTLRGVEVKKAKPDTLNPGKLRWMRERSRIRRMWSRTRSQGFRVAVAVANVIVLPAFMFIVLSDVVSGPPRLVDVKPYDFGTIDGQRDFAREVDRRSGLDQPGSEVFGISTSLLAPIFIAVLCGLLVFMSVGDLLGKPSIPRSLVAEEVSTFSQSDRIESRVRSRVER